jgi:membrane protein YdbS with pleckstrin-like domain
MRYSDSLLADGEVVARRARQHWLALVVDARAAWVLILVGLLALIVGLFVKGSDDPWGTIGNALSVIALAALVLGLLDAVYHALRWRTQDYVITNRRVVKVEGILNKRAADSSLEKINDAVLAQNLLGRILRYGDLDIITASESAIDRFRMLAHAADFKREMLNQKHALELEVGRAPSPALRAERTGDRDPDRDRGRAAGLDAGHSDAEPDRSEVPAPSPVAGAAPAWGAPTRDTSPDRPDAPPDRPDTVDADPHLITATLGRLADLRDRGAITPQEFEAKKTELLARL